VTAFITSCGGFLLAVLWMDLMFDVQVRPHRDAPALPEPVLSSIAAYYRRVTTEADPMGRLVGLVMGAAAFATFIQLFHGAGPFALRVTSLLLLAAPLVLAARRVFPNAVRLGARRDPPETQSALARSICRDHLLCLAAIVAFVAIEIARG